MPWDLKANIIGPEGPRGPQGLDGVNAVANDTATAGYVSTTGTSATKSAIRALMAGGSGNATLGIDSTIAKLDMRSDETVVFASCGDSTMDTTAEFYALAVKELLAELWPERPVNYVPLAAGSATLGTPVVWQAGGTGNAVVTGTIFSDSFNRTGDLRLSTPDVGGGTWGGGASQMSTDGTVAKITGTAYAGQAATLAHNGMDLTFSLSTWLSTSTAAAKTFIAQPVYVDNNNYIAIKATYTTTMNLFYLLVKTASTERILGYFPNSVVPSSTASTAVTISASISGAAISGTVNGQVISGTLTEAERAALRQFGKVGIYADDIGFQMDNFLVTGRTLAVGEAIDVPAVTVYNAAVSGSTAAYHLSRLSTIYPVRPDVLFFAHGHNYPAPATPASFLTTIEDFFTQFLTLYPGVPIIIMSENPRFGVGGDVQLMAAKMVAVKKYAKDKGYGYIGTYEAIAKAADGGRSLVNVDGIHPEAAGSRVQADEIKRAIRRLSSRA